MPESHQGKSRCSHKDVPEEGRHSAVIHTSSLMTMWLALLTYQLATLLLVQAQNVCLRHSTFRSPVNSDIKIFCGSQRVDLEILLCPLYYSGYNESLVLNAVHSKDQCKGTADWTADPPVVKFNFSITDEAISACSNKLTLVQEVGTGLFADFSNVQSINISGMICPQDQRAGVITYQRDVMYKFSCHYPLQYLVNNTQIVVAGSNLAIKDSNGSFISTLSMQLYSDQSYSSVLQIPPRGLELKTRIFVEVKASNLTNRFNVLLDRCYATTSLLLMDSTYYDLLVGCNRDGQTVIDMNGNKQKARFSFEAFRFIRGSESAVSTYYIHCATRLCDNTICPTLLQNCTTSSNSRKRRSANGEANTMVSETATVSSGPIVIHLDNGYLVASGGPNQTDKNSTVVAVSVIAAVVGAVCLTLVAFIVYRRYHSKTAVSKTTLYPQD